MRPYRFLTALLAVLAGTHAGYGLAQDRIGPDKDHPHPTHEQPGWPAGMVEILRHEARVYSIWVNGNDNYYFTAAPGEIGELIKLFSEVRLRDHVVMIKQGKPDVTPFNVPKAIPYNVNFRHLDGIALAMTREQGEPVTYDPTLTVFVDPAADQALLKEIVIPENIIVQSEIPNWPAKGDATVPERRLWHAEVRFKDGKPAADFENGVSTRVTLWEQDEEHPINLGTVNHKGFFHAAFSEEEIADLKADRAWLTLTVGNYLTKPSRDDQKLAPGSLVPERGEARPVVVGQPAYYHGRLLFDDGTPAIFDPEPWPGGQIALSFSYAGRVELDEDGYFKVFFTPKQYEEVKAEKARKNIYVPSFGQQGHSRALHAFPASALSLRKEEAGELRIARPQAVKDSAG